MRRRSAPAAPPTAAGTSRCASKLRSPGGGVAQRYWYVSNGLDLDAGDVSGKPGQRPVPPPACAFARLWDAAIAQGAPKDAVAQIRYDARGYTFNIPGIFNRRFSADCTVAR